jgi:hypothetical protein
MSMLSSQSGNASSSAARRIAAIERFSAIAQAEQALRALRDDPVAFAAACGLSLDDWQADALASRAKRQIWACGRQTGKSTTAAALALHTAVFQPGATVLILAKAERQSQELFLKVLRLLTGLAARSEGALSIGTNAETAMQLRLANGARIIALPGNAATVRSYRADLLLIDEAAQVPNELLMSVLPMIAVSRGTLVLLSSCYGARGFFYDVWRGASETAGESAGDDPNAEPWLRKRVSSEDCPRIPAAYLREAKATMGRWWYAGEFLAEFVDPEDAVFTQRDIDAMTAEDYEPWDLKI